MENFINTPAVIKPCLFNSNSISITKCDFIYAKEYLNIYKPALLSFYCHLEPVSIYLAQVVWSALVIVSPS